MKIGFILPRFFASVPFGGYRVVYELANGLAAKGHEVDIFFPAGGLVGRGLFDGLLSWWRKWLAYLSPVNERELKVKWMVLDERVRSLLFATLDSDRWRSLDAIVATAWQTAELLAEEGGQLRARKLYLIQGYETMMGPKGRVDATWRLPFRKVVVSEWLKNLALKFGDQQPVKATPVIDFNLFRILRPVEERDRLTIGMMYHLPRFKGGKDALKALEIVRRQYPGIKVKCISVHPLRPLVPRWVECHINPPQERLAELYNECAVFISSSWVEGFGLPGAEALACGCALATTDSLGVREYAIDGETALLSPPRDPERLAENVIRLMNDELRMRLARQGNQFIQCFTRQRTADIFEEAIYSTFSGP